MTVRNTKARTARATRNTEQVEQVEVSKALLAGASVHNAIASGGGAVGRGIKEGAFAVGNFFKGLVKGT